MTTPLQQAAQAMIDRWDSTDWKDTPHTAHYVAELRKALDAELAQSVPEGYVLVPIEAHHGITPTEKPTDWGQP